MYKWVNHVRVSPIYIRDLNLIITVSADVLAPNGARPSADTVLTEKWDTLSFKFRWLSMILLHVYGPMTSSKMAAEIPQSLINMSVDTSI